MYARTELRRAFRSLPWYLVASILLTPLVAAPFTAGSSLVLYAVYFVYPASSLSLCAAPGVLFWLIRQFARGAIFVYLRNRAY